jgi:8-oxo-dGTP diphosphatase
MSTVDSAPFHIVLAQAVAFKDGKVLIAQRSLGEISGAGQWSIPGGKVEKYGEDVDVIEKTIHTEFMEEVGIELEDRMEYLRSGSFVRKDGSTVVSLTFIADWKAGEAQPLDDTAAVRWVGPDELEGFDWAYGVVEKIELAFKRRA